MVRWLLGALGILVFLAPLSAAADRVTALPAATVAKLPRWRGFNLLDKFQQDNQRPFREKDFRIIQELGFNAVRLPMDYRCWIKAKDWRSFSEATFQDIDQAVAWGKQYGIHVMINFHRAPGYTVATPPEAQSIWKDAEALEVCALHWRTFAKRYQGISNARLTFDLMNEPAHIDSPTYARVAKVLIEAIHKEDPQRLVIADGLDFGRIPCPELIGWVAQSLHCYDPFSVTHYRASWVPGSDRMPLPAWPLTKGDGLLAGPNKKNIHGPLRCDGPFPTAVRLRLKVDRVSDRAHLVVKAGNALLWEHEFVCGPGDGEWKQAVYKPKYKLYQNIYERDYTCIIPAGTTSISILNDSGDWLQLSELGLRDLDEAARETTVALEGNWKNQPAALQVARKNGTWIFNGGTLTQDRNWIKSQVMAPWLELKSKGVGVVIGEFGALNKTPHDVVLRWMEDNLANWKEAEWGWLLWEFRGGFGILDSERSDVMYEDFHGHKLDRRMLELLQKY